MIKKLFVVLVLTMTQIVSANSDCELPSGSYVVLSEASIMKALGSPDHQDTFQVKDAVNESRVELLNIYTADNPANLEARIWEYTWNKEDCRITVWFHEANKQKFSILSRGWHKNEEF